jgi:hypothetical protein
MNQFRFFLFNAALVAVVMTNIVQGQDECDPCQLIADDGIAQGAFLTACEDDPIIKAIIEKDSSCGNNWDAFCLVTYNDCYNFACGANQQNLVDSIALGAAPGGNTLNRTQILNACPDTESPTLNPTPNPTLNPTPRPVVPPTPAPFAQAATIPPVIPPTPAPFASAATPRPVVPPTPAPFASAGTMNPSNKVSYGGAITVSYGGSKGGKGGKGGKGSKGNGGMGVIMSGFMEEGMPGYSAAMPNKPNNGMYPTGSSTKYGSKVASTRSKIEVAALFAEGSNGFSAATPSSISYSYSCVTITAAVVGALLITLF